MVDGVVVVFALIPNKMEESVFVSVVKVDA